MIPDSGNGTQAVERAVSLLACFSAASGELRIADLCVSTGLGQSTVSRMMASLERMKYVVQDERTGLFWLGPAAISLGTIALNGSPTFTAARQVSQDLAFTTGFATAVAELSGLSLFYLCNFEGVEAPKSFSMSGRVGSLHATSLGKTLMSGMAAGQIDEYFAGAVNKFTPHTIIEPEEMNAAIEAIRRKGYAIEREELAFGWTSVAAPIRDRSGNLVAALSAGGPLSAVDLPSSEELALTVVEAASKVSALLGHDPSRSSLPLPSMTT